MNTISISDIEKYLLDLQNNICEKLAAEDGSQIFISDKWERPDGGFGITRVLSNGKVIEKGGVNYSHVFGNSLPSAATIKHPQLTGCKFEALGLSLVIHPLNPYAPTTHLNVRFFCASKDGSDPVWWFGGGLDLTPYYGFTEDCVHWHQFAKNICDPFGSDIYAKYKKNCDEYFYLKHRQEPRGIGGLFFDDLNSWEFNRCFEFMRSVGDNFIPAYLPILTRRKNHSYDQREKEFQLYRRGRYVEFNLMYDRGTLFGLQWGGRVESILISLPPTVNWVYNWQPQPNTQEAKLYDYFLKPKDWLKEI